MEHKNASFVQGKWLWQKDHFKIKSFNKKSISSSKKVILKSKHYKFPALLVLL